MQMTREIKQKVDQKGIVGAKVHKNMKRSSVVLPKGDKKMSMSEKCCR